METPVLSRPLTCNGSVGNSCALHRGQWVWHNSSSCVDRGTVALFLGGLVVAAWIIELKTIHGRNTVRGTPRKARSKEARHDHKTSS